MTPPGIHHGLPGHIRRLLWGRAIQLAAIVLLCWTSPSPATGERVARVIDGDTILLEDGRKVRYAGINAPEDGDPGFRESMQANNALVGGKEVRLEFGPRKTFTL